MRFVTPGGVTFFVTRRRGDKIRSPTFAVSKLNSLASILTLTWRFELRAPQPIHFAVRMNDLLIGGIGFDRSTKGHEAEIG